MGMYITVTGVYNHYPSLFELLQLPDGIDMETARDNILFQCGELELIYSEPSFLRAIIGNWSKRRAYKWKTLQGTTTLEYNPIENYDREETWTDSTEEAGSYTEKKTGTQNTSTTGNSSTEGGSTGNSDTLEKRKGFEGGDLVETAGQTVNDSTSENAKTDTTATGEANTSDDTEGGNSKKTDYTHTGHVHGNIGVTTSQQMLMSERDVADFSIYDVIAQDFAREFCLYVY